MAAIAIERHRDGSYTVRLRYEWQECAKRHRVVRFATGRLWCVRCEQQCGATIALEKHLELPQQEAEL